MSSRTIPAPSASGWAGESSSGTPLEDLAEAELYQLIAERIDDLIILVDQEGHYVYASPSHRYLLGYDPASLLGRSVFDLMHPDDQATVLDAWSAVLSQSQASAIFRFRHADGSWRWLEARGSVTTLRGVPYIIGVARDITHRRRMEEEHTRLLVELQRQRERMDAIVAHVPGIVWEAWGEPDAASQRIDFVSDHIETLLGYSVREWLETPNFWLSIVHPEDKERAAREAAAIFTSRKGGVSQFRWIARDGRVVWVEAHSVVVCGESGAPIGMRGVTMDITARKETEQALRESEERYRQLIELSPEPIAVHSAGRLVYINQAGVRLAGARHPEELLGRSILDFVHPKYRELVLARVRQTQEQGSQTDLIEEQFIRLDGQVIDVEVAAIPTSFAGRPATQVVIRDITARKRSADRIARLQMVTAALSEALTAAQVAQVVVDQGIAAMDAQAGFIALLRNEPGGARLEIAASAGYAPELVAAWRAFPLDTPVPLADAVRSGEVLLLESRAARAARYPHLATEQAIAGPGAIAAIPLLVEGRAIGGIGLSFAEPRAFDADDRSFMVTLARQCAQALERARLYDAERQARAEAQEALQMREIFMSVAAHELKTPLTSVLGYAELLERRALREGSLTPRDQRTLGLIVEQAARLHQMIVLLLDLSRIESGHLRIERARLDLNALIRRVVEETRSALDRHTIEYDGPGEPLIVEGDALRLEQVLQNLVQNAIKYSPEGSEVHVRAGQRGDQVCVDVIDQGIGIPSGALPQLFQRFYRAPNVDPHQISGMGIGLYVVKEIISLHGGEVSVSSQEGKGSTFTVCLPLWAG